MIFRKHFFKYYLKYGVLLLIGLTALVIVDYVQLEIPEIVGNIIDRLSETKFFSDRKFIDDAIIMNAVKNIAIFTGIIVLGRIVWRFFIFGTSRVIEFELRNAMFKHATSLSQSFYAREKVGGMMTYFINDLEAIRMAFGPGLLMLVDGVMLGFFAVRKMIRLSGSLTLYATFPMVLLLICMVLIMRSMQKKFKERQEKYEKLSDFTQENFSGITVIKAFVREAKELMFFQKKSTDLYDTNMAFVKRNVMINIIVGLAINLVVLVIMGYGSYIVLKNPEQLTAGQLSEYLQYYFALIWPTMAIAQFLGIHAQSSASAKRIGDFLDSPIDLRDNPDVILPDKSDASIEFNHLTFTYPDGENPVLKDISFKIDSGEMVGILGRTGSGKSSMVDLILRLYNVEDNQILIGGSDVNKVPITFVRDKMGYVPQDNFLFSDTIKHNIAFAKDIDDSTLIDVAKQADVYQNIVEFKEQFDTMLGERGVTVSGGQKQRISIARALAKDPDILILDDSVSAVDTETEEAIITNLRKVRQNKTTLFIAHRISTVKKMDKIILLEKGELVAIGSHETLLKTSPLYQQMVKLQALEEMVMGGEIDERL